MRLGCLETEEAARGLRHVEEERRDAVNTVICFWAKMHDGVAVPALPQGLRRSVLQLWHAVPVPVQRDWEGFLLERPKRNLEILPAPCPRTAVRLPGFAAH